MKNRRNNRDSLQVLMFVLGFLVTGLVLLVTQAQSAQMANYPLKTTPINADSVIIVDSADLNRTKRATLDSLPGTGYTAGTGIDITTGVISSTIVDTDTFATWDLDYADLTNTPDTIFTNLVTNGHFTTTTTGWSQGSAGSNLSISSERLLITSTTEETPSAIQTIAGLVVGQTYRTEATLSSGLGLGGIAMTSVTWLGGVSPGSLSASGTYVFFFTATGTESELKLSIFGSSPNGTWDNVKIYKVDPASKMSELWTGSGTHLLSDGTRGSLGAAASLGATNGTIGHVITWVDGGSCSDPAYTTEATCVAEAETWTPLASAPIDVASGAITDSGNLITATTIEGALAEHRTAINLNTAKVTNTDDQTATEVPVTATGFTGNLSGTDTNVQTALATIDAMTVSGSDTLGDLSCTTDQVAKWNGTAWACAADATAAGAGYVSTVPTYSDSACTAGQYAFNTTTGYVCVASGDWNTFALTNWSAPTPDTTPDAFSFTNQTDVAVSTEITSARVQITGINTDTEVSATGGTAAICTSTAIEDCGTFGAAPGDVTNNQYVAARHTSSASASTAVDTVVTVGTMERTFRSTTAAGSTGISREGTTYTALVATDTGSITDITIPADSTLAIITASGYGSSATAFSAASVTLDSQSATLHVYQQGITAQQVAIFSVSGFATGASKTLAWDWGGSASLEGYYISIAYFSGVDTTSPVRSSGSEQVTNDGNPSAGTLTAQSGDYAVGVANMYGTGSSVTWTGLTADTFMDAGTTNALGNSSYGENSSVSGNLTVSASCTSCSNYASVAAMILKPE